MYHLYNLRVIFDVVGMPWDWPVAVNYHEAAAYCCWKTATQIGDKTVKTNDSVKVFRLMSEVEHHAIRNHNAVCNAATTDEGGSGRGVMYAEDYDPVLHYDGGTLHESVSYLVLVCSDIILMLNININVKYAIYV